MHKEVVVYMCLYNRVNIIYMHPMRMIKVLLFAGIFIKLEVVVLNERSQGERHKYHLRSFIYDL